MGAWILPSPPPLPKLQEQLAQGLSVLRIRENALLTASELDFHSTCFFSFALSLSLSLSLSLILSLLSLSQGETRYCDIIGIVVFVEEATSEGVNRKEREGTVRPKFDKQTGYIGGKLNPPRGCLFQPLIGCEYSNKAKLGVWNNRDD